MSKVAILCTDKVEEVECLTVVDYLRRANITVDMISRTGNLEITGAHGIVFKAEKLLEDCMTADDMEALNPDDYDGIILPGGAGWEALYADYRVRDSVLAFNEKQKLTAAICASPGIFARLGILREKRATIYPGMEADEYDVVWMDKAVVQSGHIITGQGPSKAGEFAIALIGYLEGRGTEAAIREQVLQEF